MLRKFPTELSASKSNTWKMQGLLFTSMGYTPYLLLLIIVWGSIQAFLYGNNFATILLLLFAILTFPGISITEPIRKAYHVLKRDYKVSTSRLQGKDFQRYLELSVAPIIQNTLNKMEEAHELEYEGKSVKFADRINYPLLISEGLSSITIERFHIPAKNITILLAYQFERKGKQQEYSVEIVRWTSKNSEFLFQLTELLDQQLLPLKKGLISSSVNQ